MNRQGRAKAVLALATFLCSLHMLPVMADGLKGRVTGIDGKPLADVVVSSPGCKVVQTEADGSFTFEGVKGDAAVTFKREGFYTRTEHVRTADLTDQINVHLIPISVTRYNESTVLAEGTSEAEALQAGNHNVTRKDFHLGVPSVEEAMRQLTGLRVTNKSGMTGEGAYIQLRGVKSLIAANNPLYVINGVPYLPDMNESMVTGGYSRSVFQALNGQDIKNITVLKGSGAAIYGSMAADGVVLIETDQASKVNMDTRISFNAMYGTNWNKSRIPLMNSSQYKNYLTDVALTYYPNQEAFFNEFSFMSNPNANNAELYTYDTNWQDEVMRNSTSKDFLFRVEGGDAIAKYNISLGYTGDDGTLKNTFTDRYNAQINASVLVSRKFEILASVNTAYLKGSYMEQGMSYETNPLLAAYRRSPLLSPRRSDIYGQLISNWSTYNYGAITNSDFFVSNPAAIVSDVNSKAKQYDLNGKIQLVYRPINELTINGIVGLYYNYNQESLFIPGKTSGAIMYTVDGYGKSDNAVHMGTDYTFNMYYGLNANFNKTLSEKHSIRATLGIQATTTSYEYDTSHGRNTANDYYQSIGSAQGLGRYIKGYNDKWNWMDIYTQFDYTYANTLKLGVSAALDGSSADSRGFAYLSLYPAADAVLMMKQLPFLRKVDFINKLDVYTNVSLTGNSRYLTKQSHSYYTSTPYLTLSGIVRANLATTARLHAEKNHNFNIGAETSLWNNRARLGIEYYNTHTTNVITLGTTTSVLGKSTFLANSTTINSRGMEMSFAVMPVVCKDFQWTIGASATTVNNKVRSTGGMGDVTYTLSDDATIITRAGENPYSFYGYQTAGVYSTTAEANKENLLNSNGQAYQAGDVRFIDQNSDGVIDDDDKVVLGSATPSIYGSFFTRFEYKGFALDLDFGYQTGGKAYNAMRRITESSLDLSNQSTSVLRRWSMEGQVTDMPRAEWGDPRGNNIFSDRWIEKTDFLKLRNISLSYTYNKPLWQFLQGATVYVSAQNLFTVTDYLGLDPEFAYSYDTMMQGIDYGKVNAPRSVRFGVNLKF